MRQSESLQINAQGHLTIGGCDAVELAREYGTPLYVLDETGVRAACRSYRDSIDRFYGGQGNGLLRQQGLLLQGDLPDHAR